MTDRPSSSVIRPPSPNDPATQRPVGSRPPWPGRSLWPALIRDGSVDHADLWWFHAGNRALRVGDWKIVSHGRDPWELYDLSTDRSEMHDLAARYPERVLEMARAWNARLEEFKRDAGSGQG